MADAAILNQLVTSLSALVAQMNQQNAATAARSQVVDILLSQNITFDNFDANQESFTSYRNRLDNFLALKQLVGDTDEIRDARVKVLLNSLGSKYFELISTLTAPKSPADHTYDELITILENHLCPKPNVLTEQHRFLSRLQKPDETIPQFVAALRKYTTTCEFNCPHPDCQRSLSDIFLRAQFIRGLKDATIREKLLQHTERSFEKLYEIATSIEVSKLENRETFQKPNESNTSVNKLSQNSKKPNSTTSKSSAKSQPGSSKSKPREQQRSNHQSRTHTHSNKPRVDFAKLGIKGLCLHCALSNHETRKCNRDRNSLHCASCGKDGHVEKVCVTTLTKRQSVHLVQEDDFSTFSVNKVIIDIPWTDDSKFVAEVSIEGTPCRFEVDSGSPVSVLPHSMFKKMGISSQLRKTDVQFRTYTKQLFQPLGITTVPVTYNNIKADLDLYVVEPDWTPIIGRKWIRQLHINLLSLPPGPETMLNTVANIDTTGLVKDLLHKYADVFEEKIGKIPDVICTLPLREGAKPVFLKARPVPYALLDAVNNEIDKLVASGIWEKADFSDWGSPLVIREKPRGGVRICADYKVAVNKQLEPAHYPIPRIEDILNKLQKGNFFVTLDIHQAFLHVEMDKTSQAIQTVSTHRGTFRPTRLNFGIKVAPNEFQRIIDQKIQHLPGTVAYLDDIICQGSTLEECHERLMQLLDVLRANKMHVNVRKCQFFVREIKYLGHTISGRGIERNADKVAAITAAPRPKTVAEVRTYLGLVNYYGKFLKDLSTLLAPLNQLLVKGTEFIWTPACEKAYKEIQRAIISDQVLTPFDPSLPVTLATDASPVGISAVLSHLVDGEEKPVAFASRTLTATERNYSQLDREATAIYWAIKKFYLYLYGRKFTLVVDNKPLASIIHPDKSLPATTTSRMLRYAHFLSGFDYDVRHRRSEHHANVDYLSRFPIPLSAKEELEVDSDYFIQMLHINKIVDHVMVASETDKDDSLSQLKKDLQSGANRDAEYSLNNGVILRGTRVVIPSSLQKTVLAELHESHVGISKMKTIARQHCYWKSIDRDIEATVRSCRECANIKPQPQPSPAHSWDIPQGNWERLHIDYAGPLYGYHYLIVVDAKSKWPEIVPIQNAPTSQSTISALTDIFTRQGLPLSIVSDNAAIFKSKEFVEFLTKFRIKQRLIAPGHPATNGLAERYVQIFKSKLKSLESVKAPIEDKVKHILYRFRCTPLASGKTPAENLLGRRLRCPLDCLQPSPSDKNKNPQPQGCRSFLLGQRVKSRNYSSSHLYRYGTVVEKLGKLHYLIELDDGYIIKRHVDQLAESEVPPPDDDTLLTSYSQPLPMATPQAHKNAETLVKPSACNGETPPQVPRTATAVQATTPPVPAAPSPRPPETLRRSGRPKKPVDRLNL